MKKFRILAINPGSTSTKLAVYEDEKLLDGTTLRHSVEELEPYDTVVGQFGFRKELITRYLSQAGIGLDTLDAVIGRGGLVKPITSGVYLVNDDLIGDLKSEKYGSHASNLGALIAADIAAETRIKAFIADPVVVDELQDAARVTGIPGIERRSIFHALNHKAVARRYASSCGKSYDQLRLVVAHLGGGISVGAHLYGKVIDVNNALDGEGPLTPERAGTIPAGQLCSLCFDSGMSHKDIVWKITGAGGFIAHLGTNDTCSVISRAVSGAHNYKKVLDAMCYGIGKNIGSMAAVLHGKVDAIILTGGIAYNTYVCDYVKEMVSFIAPVEVYPGEDELDALAFNALLVMKNLEEPKIYIS